MVDLYGVQYGLHGSSQQYELDVVCANGFSQQYELDMVCGELCIALFSLHGYSWHCQLDMVYAELYWCTMWSTESTIYQDMVCADFI